MELSNQNFVQEYYNNYSNKDSFNQMNYLLNESKSTRETIVINNNQLIKHAKHISLEDAVKYSVNSFNSSGTNFNSNYDYFNDYNIFYFKNPELNYLDDIYNELLIEEKKNEFFQSYDYMSYQYELTPKLRACLINFIYTICQYFNLNDKTLYLSIQILDRFLCSKKIDISYIQLLGASSLFISTKFNEIIIPPIDYWLKILKGKYNKNEFLVMEYFILDSIDYNILPLYPVSFFEIINEKIKFNKYEFYLGLLLIEISQFEYNIIKYKSSIIVQSVVYLLLSVKKKKNPNLDINDIMLNIFQGVDLKKNCQNTNNIKNCSHLICILMDNIKANIFEIVYKKFSSKEYYNVTDFSLFM